MEKQKQLPQFSFKEISEKIEAKREIYISLIRSTFNFSSVNDEEKTQIASDKFTAEKELYIERLKDLWVDANDAYIRKGTITSLSIFQGVNIFMEVLQMGLSFSKTANYIYLAQMIGTRGEVGWKPTPNGVVYLCQLSGEISHISEIIIVTTDEKIEFYNEDGELKVNHKFTPTTDVFNYEKFLCAYFYTTYSTGYRELKVVTRQHIDDAKNSKHSRADYNMISTLKSKTVTRGLKFDRKTMIKHMVNSSSNLISQNKTKGLKEIYFDDDGNVLQASGRANRNVNLDIPEIAKDLDEVVEELPIQEVPQQEEQQQEEKKTDLFGGLDLDFLT